MTNENKNEKAFRELLRVDPYHPVFSKITGSTSCGILLSQLYYYGGGANNEGWFCKTNEDFCEETGLTIETLKTAKGKLAKLGLIKTERRGIPSKTWYFVNYNIIINEISKI
jgi:hypothetical protein